MLHIASLLRLLSFITSRCKAKYVTRSVSIISLRLRDKISTKLLIRIFSCWVWSNDFFAYWAKKSLSYPKRVYSLWALSFVTGDSLPGLKRQGFEADHLTQTSVEVKGTWSYNSTNPICFSGVHRDLYL
jgi:hypothetical protein